MKEIPWIAQARRVVKRRIGNGLEGGMIAKYLPGFVKNDMTRKIAEVS